MEVIAPCFQLGSPGSCHSGNSYSKLGLFILIIIIVSVVSLNVNSLERIGTFVVFLRKVAILTLKILKYSEKERC